MKKNLILLSIITLLVSCSAKKSSGSEGAFTVLKQGTNSTYEQETNLLINSQKELASLYKELNDDEVPNPDFKNKSIVAVFMGQKRTGGYAITVTDVKVKNGAASITTVKSTPEGGIVTMALTQPYCIAEIPKAEVINVK